MPEAPPWEADVQLPDFIQNAINEVDEVEPEPVEDRDEFDGEVGTDVIGLLNLGRLTRKYDVLGHTFVMKTLTIGEQLAIAHVANDYAGTILQGQAWQTAIVAAATVSVDGRELVAALGPDTLASLQDRFNYVSEKWYPRTIEEAYNRYQELLEKQEAAYEAVQGKSTASRTTSTP